MTVRSLIRFEVKPGREAAFEEAFRDCGMLTRPRAIEGFRGAELLRAADAANEYIVIADWAAADDYRAWQAIALQGAPAGALARLADTLSETRPGRLFVPVR